MHSRSGFARVKMQEREENEEQISLLDYGKEITAYNTFDEDDEFTTPYSFVACFLSYLPAIINLFLSLYAALPVFPLGLGFVSNTYPKDFTRAWWENLSTQTKIFSVCNAFISFAIATLTRYRYFPDVAKKLLNIFMSCCASLCSFANTNLILLLSIAAAIAAGALGYDSFVWGGELLAIMAALANFMTVGGFRITFVSSLFERISKRFDEDYAFRQRCIEIFSQLKKKYADELNELFKGKEINEETVREFLFHLHKKAQDMESEQAGSSAQLFKTPSRYEQFKGYAASAFDYVFATYLGCCFGDYFAQFGPHGLEIICQSFDPDCSIDTLSLLSHISIAALTSISSAILAFLTGLEFRQFVAYTCQRIKENPRDLFLLGGILILFGIASTPVYVAAFGVSTHFNILSMWLFVFGNVGLDFIFNCKAGVDILMKQSLLATVGNSKLWLGRNELSKESVKELKHLSFFAVKNLTKSVKNEIKNRAMTPAYCHEA